MGVELDRPRRAQRSIDGDRAAACLQHPPTGAITNAVTPSAAAAFTNLDTPARSEPASAMIPILRPSIRPGSPKICTNAGETVTPSAGLPFGAGRPRPVATCSHRSVSTLAGTWSSRSLNQEFDRANKIDPDTQIDDTAPRTPQPVRQLEKPSPASKAHQRCPEPGSLAHPGRQW